MGGELAERADAMSIRAIVAAAYSPMKRVVSSGEMATPAGCVVPGALPLPLELTPFEPRARVVMVHDEISI